MPIRIPKKIGRPRKTEGQEFIVELNSSEKHPIQQAFIDCEAKRIMVRAGRRGGKTVGVSIKAVKSFLKRKRVLYAAPMSEQVDRFWTTVCRALQDPIDKGVLYKNESLHIIEVPGTEIRIKAKSAWNADTLRGDYADILILDEWQLMNEDTWELVGAPMLLDNNGDAIFIYTPPSLRTRSIQKSHDPQHAAKMFIAAQAAEKRMVEEGKEPRWRTFHFSSMQNPYISKSALEEITQDMTSLAYRMEILAEDVTEVPGALWKRDTIEQTRILTAMRDSEWDMIVVGVDPSATSTGDEAGIITAAKKGSHGYTLADNSVQGSPAMWAGMAVKAYRDRKANKIVAESNNGGEMVAQVIHQVDPNVPVELVHASRGKATRAEPVSALFEKGGGHHCGYFPYLEDEMCLWQPGGPSPNRLDAMVWAMTGLGIVNQTEAEIDWVKVVGM